MSRVFVAMSGGVDSSVAAALLVEQGHSVTGVTMQLLTSTEDEDGCCSASAARDARRVCDQLGIPHFALDLRDDFEREVVGPFADEYASGRTPNPCIVCNERMKFSYLLAYAMTQGAEFLATGHYARILRDADGSQWLARGLDTTKDQSYFLYRLTPHQMEHLLFPLGDLEKSLVRTHAARFGLWVAEKPESQEICFAPSGHHTQTVRRRHPEAFEPGPVVDLDGHVLGSHTGLADYTVGQRKGIGIASAGPLYVIELDAVRNRLVVGTEDALFATGVLANDVVWRGAEEQEVEAVVRYRMLPAAARAVRTEGALRVRFREPLRGVAPGQAVVCYAGERVLGGGVIACAD